MAHFHFIFENSSDDTSYLVVEGASLQEARLSWVEDMKAKGWAVRLDMVTRFSAAEEAAFGKVA